MNKLHIIVLGLVIYVILTVVIVVPLQGGEIFGGIFTVTSSYNETFDLQLGPQAGSTIIAVFMLGHVMLANLGLGGSWVVAIAETTFIRSGKQKYDRLARSLSQFNVIMFSTGSTFAVAGLTMFIALFPQLTTQLFHIFFWPLFIELLMFGVGILSLYTFYLSFDKISKKYHQILAYTYAISTFIQTLLINMVASAMLSPGSTTLPYTGSGTFSQSCVQAIAWWFNPTEWILTFHRFAAAISYFGLMLAMLAMLQFRSTKSVTEREHWDWVASYGMSWGLAGLIAQPVLGMAYMQIIQNVSTIPNVSTNAFDTMMNGQLAWEMLLMVGYFAALFLTLIVYFLERREIILSKPENAFLHKMFKSFLVISAICAIILVQPAWFGTTDLDDPGAIINPFGYMSFKYIAFFAIMVMGVIMFLTNWRMLKEQRDADFGHLSKTARSAIIIAGLLGIWLVADMGFFRESSREPWVINGLIPIPDFMPNTVPLSVDTVFIVFAALTVFTFAVFWLVSRVAYYRSNYGMEKVENQLREEEHV